MCLIRTFLKICFKTISNDDVIYDRNILLFGRFEPSANMTLMRQLLQPLSMMS